MHGAYIKVIYSICFVTKTTFCNTYTLDISYLSKKLNENISEIFACVLYRYECTFLSQYNVFNKIDVI